MAFIATFIQVMAIGILYTDARVVEPVCSKYQYEIQILERVLRFEQALERFDEKISAFEDKLDKKVQNAAQFQNSLDQNVENIGQTLKAYLDEVINKQAKVMQNEIKTMAELSKSECNNKMNVVENTFSEALTNMMADINSTVSKEFGAYQENITTIETKVKALKQKMDNVDDGESVVFSVTTPSKTLLGSVPIFKKEVINIGGGYNTSTGIFICPVTGVYYFFLSLLTQKSGMHPDCTLRLNGAGIILVQADSDVNDTAAGAVYLRLNKGDKVDLKCNDWNHVSKSTLTTFSGSLFHATD